MPGGVNCVERCRTLKYTTNSFAVNPAMIPNGTSLPFALRATPLLITAEGLRLVLKTMSWYQLFTFLTSRICLVSSGE